MSFREDFPERVDYAIRTVKSRIKQINVDLSYMEDEFAEYTCPRSPEEKELDEATKNMWKREREVLTTIIRALEE